jgi:phage tail-like protein
MPDLVDLLPEVMQVTAAPATPLAALGAVAGDLHGPVHDLLDDLDAVIDPYRTPEAFLPALASWVGMEWLTVEGNSGPALPAEGIAAHRLRDVIAAAADLSASRGSPEGIGRFLELATGQQGFVITAGPQPFHLTVGIPASLSEQSDLIDRLVGQIKPVHVMSEVAVLTETADREEEPHGDLD